MSIGLCVCLCAMCLRVFPRSELAIACGHLFFSDNCKPIKADSDWQRSKAGKQTSI